MSLIAFYAFAFFAVASALLILFTKKVMYAAFALFITLLSVAGLYVLSGADFLAVTQLLIYVGGILLLILFGVMLTGKKERAKVSTQTKLVGIAIAVSVFFILIWVILGLQLNPILPIINTTKQLGIGFMTTHILPFEIIGILLLMVLVGTTYLTYFKT